MAQCNLLIVKVDGTVTVSTFKSQTEISSMVLLFIRSPVELSANQRSAFCKDAPLTHSRLCARALTNCQITGYESRA